MSWKKTTNRVYLVHWPDVDVTKAGYSAQQRYRAFVIRNAILVDLWEFKSAIDAFAFETVLDHALANLGPRAFQSSTEAIPFLGGNGAGYKECYVVARGLLPSMLASMPGAMPGDVPSIPRRNPRTDVRTYGTNERHPRPGNQSHVGRRAGENR